MKFIEDYLCQKNKTKQTVCGDHFVCERTPTGMIDVVCDGIGAGIYANIAAITCAGRLLELFRSGMSIRSACETVAASMHRARTEDIPFSAFSAAVILPDGQFVVYSYEAPNPVILQNNHAVELVPRFYTAGFEVIGEVTGTLHMDDALLLFSDGVSQAGMGHGPGMGIGSDGVAGFINRNFKPDDDIAGLPQRIVEMCKTVSAGNHEDDTTLVLLHCREARELTLLTGPPSQQSLDKVYATDFWNMPGRKIICGSTTTEIVARELDEKIVTLSMGDSFQPPEYFIECADLVTEGAVTLNHVWNILDEPPERLTGGSVAERMCLMLHDADVVHLMTGNAPNTAHEDMIFKQVGVHVRKSIIRQIVEHLKNMGKLVLEKGY